jgi:hypothetical protein
VIQTIRAILRPLATINKRVSVGGGGLALILGGQTMLSLMGPFA